MSKKNSKKNSNSSLSFKKCLLSLLLILILVILVLNHLKIILFIKQNNCILLNQTSRDVDTNEVYVSFPQVYESIEHLTHKKDNLFKPKILITQNRHAKFILGIPTLKRENVTYLEIMLNSLLLAMNQQEKNQVLIVILLAEIKDKHFNKEMLKFLLQKYKYDIANGYIDVIAAPSDYYPNENRIVSDHIFNDKPERIKWRVKQNYDICFLMTYSRERGIFYLQVNLKSIIL